MFLISSSKFFISSFASPEMEFFQLILDSRYFFANSLRSPSFYKSEAKIGTEKLESVSFWGAPTHDRYH